MKYWNFLCIYDDMVVVVQNYFSIYCAYRRSFKINVAITKAAIDKTQSKHI